MAKCSHVYAQVSISFVHRAYRETYKKLSNLTTLAHKHNAMSATIQPATLKFLKDLAKNNNRDWFNAHKPAYLAAHQNMATFVDALIVEMNKQDELNQSTGKQSLFRIYNDVRFSKDK